jgi:NitT/TauT family transport system ATP-binding protein
VPSSDRTAPVNQTAAVRDRDGAGTFKKGKSINENAKNSITVTSAVHSDAPEHENAIEVRGLTHQYVGKRTHTALADIDFSARSGEFVSIVGPSGCGKSTLLFIIAGLVPSSAEVLRVLGKDVERPGNREVGVVFQRDALLPWRTAEQNVSMPLRFRGMSKAEINEIARYWLDRVGLAGFADSYPHQLSGGMRKRVAIATCLAYRPRVLLMDEPFSALDAQTRNLMENDLLQLWEETKQTVVFVTHDLEEAIGLSDRVVTMTASPGTVLSEHPVDLPRPRDLLEVRFRSEFTKLHEQLWHGLREQVARGNSFRRADQA